MQLLKFFNRHNNLQTKIKNSQQIRHKRQNKNMDYIPPTQVTPTGGAVTVDGTTVTINSQFGPVGVNNPSALLRNLSLSSLTTSPSTYQAGYETRRLGPTPLSIFTPPPLPSTFETSTFRKQVYLYFI